MSKIDPAALDGVATRKARLSLLATAPADRLASLWARWCGGSAEPGHEILRGPEIGTVMVHGRAGSVGAPFNLGELTVTRCTLRLGSGAVGHGHVQGRDKDASRIAALVDALCEGGQQDALDEAVLAPLRRERAARAATRAAKAAATRVEFFTMVRGDT